MGGTIKVVGTFALPLPLHVKRPILDRPIIVGVSLSRHWTFTVLKIFKIGR
jgi:hypothetical protein